jgi:hypothetical protein
MSRAAPSRTKPEGRAEPEQLGAALSLSAIVDAHDHKVAGYGRVGGPSPQLIDESSAGARAGLGELGSKKYDSYAGW